MRVIRGCALLAILLIQRVALANDSSFGGSGADLVPIEEKRIRMVSEDIIATFIGDWSVTAAYVFENPTNETISLQMGFPEPKCVEDLDCHVDRAFKDLETTVRDVPVKLRKGKLSLSKLSPVLGKVWLYDVTFEPRERIKIWHSYRVGGTWSLSGGYDLVYVTRTGAQWGAPIESAKFRFRLPVWMKSLQHAKWAKPTDIHIVRTAKDAYTEVVFEQQQWTPKSDLWVAFELDGMMEQEWRLPESPVAGIEPCGLTSDTTAIDAWNATQERPDTTAALAKTWSQQSAASLQTCTNNVFARYGRKFENDRYNRYFYGSKGWSPGAPPYKPYAPNPAYSTRVLTDVDWAVLKVLKMAKAMQAQATQ